jgi:hypothetical protein
MGLVGAVERVRFVLRTFRYVDESLGAVTQRLIPKLMRLKLPDAHISLGSFRLGFFFFPPLSCSSLHRPVMRMSLEMVFSTGPTEEHQDRLSVTAFLLRHGVSLAETVLIASPFWLSGAEAPASPVASASSYRCSENVRVLAIVVAELKFGKVQRKILLADVMEVSHDSALQQRPERFDIVRMNSPRTYSPSECLTTSCL